MPPWHTAMAQGCAGAMPPSAATSQPRLPQLGEGTSLPCVAPLLATSPCPSSLLCLGTTPVQGWLGGSKAAAWGRPGQTQARYNEGQELYLCRADTLHPSTCGTPKAPAVHQQLPALLPNTPRVSEHGCLGTQCHEVAGLLGVRGREGAHATQARAPRGAVFQREPLRMLSGDEAAMGAESLRCPCPFPPPTVRNG